MQGICKLYAGITCKLYTDTICKLYTGIIFKLYTGIIYKLNAYVIYKLYTEDVRCSAVALFSAPFHALSSLHVFCIPIRDSE